MNAQKNNRRLLTIVGPTGVGKTAYAVEVAQYYGAELLSVDSRQVYTGMDIATGKEVNLGSWVNVNGRKTLKIDDVLTHGLDMVDPNAQFSVHDWYTMAVELIAEIVERGNAPLLVGGTGYYLDALLGKIETLNVQPDIELRKELAELSASQLVRTLAVIDQQKANTIDSHNKRKLIRAIEVARWKAEGGKQKAEGSQDFALQLVGLTMDRDKLYTKVDTRVDMMVAEGLIEETDRLLGAYDRNLPSMTGIGYAEISQYLRGETSKAEAIQKMKWRVHSYIRRQYTWFNKQKIVWIDVDTPDWRNRADEVIRSYGTTLTW